MRAVSAFARTSLSSLSPRIRKTVFNRCLFPIGYSLYVGPAGYLAHKAFAMSSAKTPAVPHSKIDAPVVDGDGDAKVSVVLLPLFGDNFSYMLRHESSRRITLVDPADPAPVLAALKEQEALGYKVTTILTTHKHWDHAGGNVEIAKHYSTAGEPLQVVGGKIDNVDGATLHVQTGSVVELGAQGFTAQVFECPCHTRGHVIYKIGKLLFTGDTLFSGGCGRFFEGNGAEMYQNQISTNGSLPDDTIIMPGHEYTVANLEFAKWIEPDNAALAERLLWAQERRAGKWPTIPTTLAQEKSFNPFMRVNEPAVVQRVHRVLGLQAAAKDANEPEGVRVMDALRKLKNDNAHQKK